MSRNSIAETVGFIVVRSDLGQIAGKIIDSDEMYYKIEFGTGYVKVEKEYVYEENGRWYIDAHDIV